MWAPNIWILHRGHNDSLWRQRATKNRFPLFPNHYFNISALCCKKMIFLSFCGPLFVGPLFGRTCSTCLNPPLRFAHPENEWFQQRVRCPSWFRFIKQTALRKKHGSPEPNSREHRNALLHTTKYYDQKILLSCSLVIHVRARMLKAKTKASYPRPMPDTDKTKE